MVWKQSYYYFILTAILIGIIAVILFGNLGAAPLIDYDEAIYAQVSREALGSPNPGHLTWLGNVSLGREAAWSEKPPLVLWLTALNFKIFGITEWSARLWPAIFALATVVLSAWIVWKQFRSAGAAALTAAAFLASYQFLQLGSVLQMDSPVGFFVVLAVLSFYFAGRQKNFYYLFGAALGLSLMIKGVIGLLPLPIIFIYSLAQNKWHWLRQRQFYFGLLVAAAISLPWHAIESLSRGRRFWTDYLFYHVLARYRRTLELHASDKWFYWRIIKAQRVLFVGSMLGALVFLRSALRRKAFFVVVVSGAAFIFLLFSTSRTRLAAYIIPVYPFLAIMFGVSLDRIIKMVKIKTLQAIAVLVIVGGCAYLGLRYNAYNQLAKFRPVDVDNKAVGLFISDHFASLPVYCQCASGTRPAIIFYSNRAVYAWGYPNVKLPADSYVLVSEDKTADPPGRLILDTPTKRLYYISP